MAETIGVTKDAKERAAAYALVRGCSISQAASDLILRQAAGGGEVSLADAAERLLRELPAPMVALIRENCVAHRVPPVAYLLTYCLLAYERGETSTPLALTDAQRVAEAEAPALPEQAECAWCRRPFRPAVPGQRYCPDPDDGTVSCGRQAALEQVRAARLRYLDQTRPADQREAVTRQAAPRAMVT